MNGRNSPSIGERNESWLARFTLYCAAIGLAACFGFVFSLSAAPIAPDPVALKVQGPDTIGNLLPIQTQAPGATGSSATPTSSSTTNANTAQNVTLTGVAGKFTFVTGIQVTGSGATAASTITVTLIGVAGVTQNYAVVVPAGVTTSITPLVVTFPTPLASSAANTNITLSVPAFGAGNTNQAASIQGYTQ